MKDTMLTTIDNPYNPFIQFEDWDAFDRMMQYNTCALLARVTRSSIELSDSDDDLAIDRGMEEIVEQDPSGLYRIVNKKEAERLANTNTKQLQAS